MPLLNNSYFLKIRQEVQEMTTKNSEKCWIVAICVEYDVFRLDKRRAHFFPGEENNK